MNRLFGILFLILPTLLLSQQNGFRYYKGKPIYEYNQRVSKIGVHGAVGATTTFGTPDKNAGEYENKAQTNFGYLFEVGMIHIMKPKVVNATRVLHFVDWAIGIEDYRGQEETRFYVDPNQQYNYDVQGEGNFTSGYAMANVHINGILRINTYNFLNFSLGGFFKYQIYGSTAYEGYQNQDSPYNQGNILAGLDFRLGWGIKMTDQWFLVPFVEVPIMNFYEWNGAKPTFQYFSSEWMPMKFGIRLGYLFKQDPNKCSDGDANSRRMSEKYQNNR